jgi:hypothetical protein
VRGRRVILIVLGLLPKMAALVESLPTVVLGGAGLVMFGMVAATGIRILVERWTSKPTATTAVHRGGVDRHWHDSADRAQLQAVDAARHPPADRVGHLLASMSACC